MTITPAEFVNLWAQASVREQQGAQTHFNQLCEMVGHKTPIERDPQAEFFTFEEHVEKATGGKGRADVWYSGHFAWEYKGKHKDLDAAYAQLLAYRGGLGNPPLLVVCDFLEYRIYPQWPNTSAQPFVFHNEDLLHRDTLRYITWLLESPERFLELRQEELERRERITKDLAEKFAHLADLMRQHRGVDGQPVWQPIQIARFLTKLVFALFAEDIGLMPRPFDQPAFRYLSDGARSMPGEFVPEMRRLFEAMDGRQPGFVMKAVPYFNGGLFADSAPDAGDGMEVLDLTQIVGAIDLMEEVSEADWRDVDPAIFGTLFEGALDPGKRAQLGAHYTGESDIRLVVEPVLMQPLYRLWDEIQAEAGPLLQIWLKDEGPRAVADAQSRLKALYQQMMTALENMRVLDPACGSGNFLYVSLRAMKDLEARVRKYFESLGLPFADVVTPQQFLGIEKDEFAARLAYVVTWIGYLQWRYQDEGVLHPYLKESSRPHPRQLPHPILQDNPNRIVNDDAIMRYRPHPPAPSLRSGEGERETDIILTRTSADLWEKIKPLAREMRTNPTPAEDQLWQRVRGREIAGYRFRRQHPIDRFMVDFYCAEARLVVEVDGPIHDYTPEQDALRQEFLESLGLQVLRFTNDEVLYQLDAVLERIREVIEHPHPPIPLRSEGEQDTTDLPSLRSGEGPGGGTMTPYEPDWPEADVIIGNPPFLGAKRMKGELGEKYVDDLHKLYEGRLPGFSDLVTYWFEKARAQIENGKVRRVGLLATNSIGMGTNLPVLKRIKETGDIFMAWSDREWVLEGAAVRIAIVGFDNGTETSCELDGRTVASINADLTESNDLTTAKSLEENMGIAFIGTQKSGPFDIPAEEAQKLILQENPNGVKNTDVVRPWVNGEDIVRRPKNMFVIYFDVNTASEEQAAAYQAPYEYAEKIVKPTRTAEHFEGYPFWLHWRPRPELQQATKGLSRYVITPRVSKHRLFAWLNTRVVPDSATVAIARDDDYFFGVLHSYLHEIWSLRLGTSLEDRPRYTPTTTFETFPFPWPPGSEDTASPVYAAIADAAKTLHEERDAWLNPPDEMIAGPAAAKLLRERTLTHLYNAVEEYRQRNNGEANNGPRKAQTAAQAFAPRLAELHRLLDAAVLAAYGWGDFSPHPPTPSPLRKEGEYVLRTAEGDEELLRRLLALNLARA